MSDDHVGGFTSFSRRNIFILNSSSSVYASAISAFSDGGSSDVITRSLRSAAFMDITAHAFVKSEGVAVFEIVEINAKGSLTDALTLMQKHRVSSLVVTRQEVVAMALGSFGQALPITEKVRMITLFPVLYGTHTTMMHPVAQLVYCMYVCMYVCMLVCMHACMLVCMYVWLSTVSVSRCAYICMSVCLLLVSLHL